MSDVATCRACPAPLLWVEMVDEHGVPKMKDGKPVRNPLDREPLDAGEVGALLEVPEPPATQGVVAFSPHTGRGMAVSRATVADVKRWVAARAVRLHTSHFVTCPARARFRRQPKAKA